MNWALNEGFLGIFLYPGTFNDLILSHEPLMYLFEEFSNDRNQRNDNHIKLIHKEFMLNEDYINVHGHIHGDDMNDERFVNASCENLKYKPKYIGKTESGSLEYINSSYFLQDVLKTSSKLNLSPKIVVENYLYSTLLAGSVSYKDSMFLYGSFPTLYNNNLYAKISDLDIGFINTNETSKKRFMCQFKDYMDYVYGILNEIHFTNLETYKRTKNLRMFTGYYSLPIEVGSITVDANYVDLDIYRNSDFVSIEGISLIEKVTTNNELPKYSYNALSNEVLLVNLFLQYCFQNNTPQKRKLIHKKILLLMKNYNKEIDFEDILIRYFLRNIGFLDILNRQSDICYIKEVLNDLNDSIRCLPNIFANSINENICGDFKILLNDCKSSTVRENIKIYAKEYMEKGRF